MSDALKSFRTLTRFGLFRQVIAGGVTTLVPIALSTPPQNITVSPGDSIEEPMELACDGREVIAFTYTKGAKPELEVDFGMAVLELEAIVHGRVAASQSSVASMVFAEFLPTSTTVAGRTTGEIGYSVIAQVGATTKAQAYYIDPDTKLAKSLTIVDYTETPDGDEIAIGVALAIKVSTALVTAGHQIYVWCPCTLPAATILTAEPTGLFSVFAQGINFDNSARTFAARNCSRLPGGNVGSDPKRQLKFRILPDAGDGTGLGYSIQDTKLTHSC